jgi:phospho-2-dehydro-3-deoxyheptonate aldolase
LATSNRLRARDRLARKLLLDVSDLGLPTASEFLNVQIPQHVADLTVSRNATVIRFMHRTAPALRPDQRTSEL